MTAFSFSYLFHSLATWLSPMATWIAGVLTLLNHCQVCEFFQSAGCFFTGCVRPWEYQAAAAAAATAAAAAAGSAAMGGVVSSTGPAAGMDAAAQSAAQAISEAIANHAVDTPASTPDSTPSPLSGLRSQFDSGRQTAIWGILDPYHTRH